MVYYADLHMHSRFARATSSSLTLPVLDEAANQKGIKVLGTGDFTHPQWFAELKSLLKPADEAGLYVLKDRPTSPVRFMLSCEISSIYSQGGKSRRVHTLFMLPSLEAVDKFNRALARRGAKLSSDGRPIVGLSVKEVAAIALDADPAAMIIPAHAWTPWFGILGSMSGFDSLEECFEDLTSYVTAIETGLSSDPPMNWRVSSLDSVALMSSSDAHSASKIAREATQFEGEASYIGILEAFKYGAPARANEKPQALTKLLGTIEFYPEEGKYHYDGHREHGVRLTPQQRLKTGGKCPVCGYPVTVGVLSRVQDLADRPLGFKPAGAPNYRSLVPLEEIIAEAVAAKVGTKKVSDQYQNLISALGNELFILNEAAVKDIETAGGPLIAEGIKRVREGNLQIEPGYDGQFGTIHVFNDDDRKSFEPTQATLF